VDLTKDAGNKLIASASELIPTNSFTAGIEAANQRIKDLANSDLTRTLQESLGKTGSFFTGTGTQQLVSTFQTGTNQLAQEFTNTAQNVLNATPFKNLQFPATAQISNQLGLDKLTQATPSTYGGNRSTNST
jgi:hypothetical protein